MALCNPTKFWPHPKQLLRLEPRIEFRQPVWSGPIPDPYDEKNNSAASKRSSASRISPLTTPASLIPAPLQPKNSQHRSTSPSSAASTPPSQSTEPSRPVLKTSRTPSCNNNCGLGGWAQHKLTSPSSTSTDPRHSYVPLSLAGITYTWCHASFLYYASNFEVAFMAYDELLKRPGLPRSVVPRLVLNMGLVSTQLGDHQRAAELFYRAVGLLPTGPIGAIGVFLLGLAIFDLRDPQKAAECFEMCLSMFAEGQDAIDMRELGLDFVLLKASVRANRAQCLERIKTERVIQMASMVDWNLTRLPADRIFEPPLCGDPASPSLEEEMEDEAVQQSQVQNKKTTTTTTITTPPETTPPPAKQLVQRLWDMYLDKPLPVPQTQKRLPQSTNVEKVVRKLFGSFAF